MEKKTSSPPPTIDDAVACIKSGTLDDNARVFHEIGQLGLLDILAGAIERIYPLLLDKCADAMEHALLGAIGHAHAAQMMDSLLKTNLGCIRLGHIKAAVEMQQLDILQRFAEHRRSHNFPAFELAGTPTIVIAMKTGNLKLLELLHDSTGVLTMRAFGEQACLEALRLELWEVVEWLIDVKHVNFDGLIVQEISPIHRATIFPWAIKRGIGFSTQLLERLLVSGENDREHPDYPYEHWLADYAMAHHRNQYYSSAWQDRKFYENTRQFPRIWKWGMEHRLCFPSFHASWMDDADIHSECRAILIKRNVLPK
jgi:hypothetical protein